MTRNGSHSKTTPLAQRRKFVTDRASRRRRARRRRARSANATTFIRGRLAFRGQRTRPRRTMPFEQYHEPPGELPEEVRTFARICVSLIEEAEAIDWYEQRLALEADREARAIMENAQQEEFKHFAMNLEFLARRKPKWRTVLEDVLFKKGDIVEHGEEAEEELD